jgi:hypothetical protein
MWSEETKPEDRTVSFRGTDKAVRTKTKSR